MLGKKVPAVTFRTRVREGRSLLAARRLHADMLDLPAS